MSRKAGIPSRSGKCSSLTTHARHYRRSVVETCGASNFDKLLELVSDVIQSAPGGTELAPIFAFGDSTRAALRSHQDFAEKPFENFLLGCMPGLS